jgi:hypothetical protein
MNELECKALIAHHGRSHRIQATAAAQRGDNERATRCNAIADAAVRGVLLAPLAHEPDVPDLYAAATAFELVEGDSSPADRATIRTAAQRPTHGGQRPQVPVEHMDAEYWRNEGQFPHQT